MTREATALRAHCQQSAASESRGRGGKSEVGTYLPTTATLPYPNRSSSSTVLGKPLTSKHKALYRVLRCVYTVSEWAYRECLIRFRDERVDTVLIVHLPPGHRGVEDADSPDVRRGTDLVLVLVVQ